jgi:signal transduction histidine kinase
MAELLLETDLSPISATTGARSTARPAACWTILNDILDFSKIEAGRLELDESDSACASASRAWSTCSSRAPTSAASSWSAGALAGARRLIGDGARVRQVSAQPGRQRGQVHRSRLDQARGRPSRRAESAPRLEFRVVDTGIGIPRTAATCSSPSRSWTPRPRGAPAARASASRSRTSWRR